MSHKLIIFSAPSGSGKTTIVKHLISKVPSLQFSISACTRPIREGKETDGVDYYFLSLDEFHDRMNHNEFVEWEEVYEGNLYGTLKTEIDRIWSEGKNVIFDVDVVGGLKLKKYYKEKALSVFVKAPSFDIIENRLRKRDTESEETLAVRLKKVEEEMKFEGEFDHIIVNDNLEEAFEQAETLVSDFIKD